MICSSFRFKLERHACKDTGGGRNIRRVELDVLTLRVCEQRFYDSDDYVGRWQQIY